ncbi:hypothetical protein MKK65_10575 [Methylobacterium sp. J-001]|uniref:hypothetical protein n=1 Tax=Methylobacterium sp. J-001 TaxID=2836609 RepID=UPI001FBA3581|nr:hypothetical protein [Methylobacterium sp. J-001]MCJ2117008.1 hypothetical protein [Methylobacterium sp. J-001]
MIRPVAESGAFGTMPELDIWMAAMARNPTVPALRRDGRRALYVYLPPALIRDLKKAALDEERPAYELVEEAVTRMLKDRLATSVRSA